MQISMSAFRTISTINVRKFAIANEYRVFRTHETLVKIPKFEGYFGG